MFTEGILGIVTGDTIGKIPAVILGRVSRGILGGISEKCLNFFLDEIFEEILERKTEIPSESVTYLDTWMATA